MYNRNGKVRYAKAKGRARRPIKSAKTRPRFSARRRSNAPLSEELTAREVGTATAFLCSPLASGITGTTLYVDKGYHTMGMGVAG